VRQEARTVVANVWKVSEVFCLFLFQSERHCDRIVAGLVRDCMCGALGEQGNDDDDGYDRMVMMMMMVMTGW
jgi:hypothetical protein